MIQSPRTLSECIMELPWGVRGHCLSIPAHDLSRPGQYGSNLATLLHLCKAARSIVHNKYRFLPISTKDVELSSFLASFGLSQLVIAPRVSRDTSANLTMRTAAPSIRMIRIFSPRCVVHIKGRLYLGSQSRY